MSDLFKELRQDISNIINIPENYLTIRDEDIPYAVDIVNLLTKGEL